MPNPLPINQTELQRETQGLRKNLRHNSPALQLTTDCLSDHQDNPNLGKRVWDSRTNSRIVGQGFSPHAGLQIRGVYLDNVNIKMSLCISTTPWRPYRAEGTDLPFFASNWMLQSGNTTLCSVRKRLNALAKKWLTIVRPNYKNTKGGICYNCISGWRCKPSQSKIHT